MHIVQAVEIILISLSYLSERLTSRSELSSTPGFSCDESKAVENQQISLRFQARKEMNLYGHTSLAYVKSSVPNSFGHK